MKKIPLLLLLFVFSGLAAQRLPEAIPYRVGEKWGLCDSTKKIIATPEYDGVSPIRLRGELLFQVDRNAMEGLIDAKGKVLLPAEYDEIRIESEKTSSFLLLRKAHQYGLCRANGTMVLPVVYSSICQNVIGADTVYCLDSLGRHGLADVNGKVLLPCRYARIDAHYNPYGEYFVVLSEESGTAKKPAKKYGMYHLRLRRITLPVVYDSPPEQHDQYANTLFVEQKGLHGLCDTLGHVLIPPIYKELWSVLQYYPDSVFTASLPKKKNNRIYLDRQNRQLATGLTGDKRYDLSTFEDDRYIRVMSGEKSGYYDLASDSLLLPVVYDFIDYQGMKPVLFWVRKGDEEQLLDAAAKVIMRMDVMGPVHFIQELPGGRIILQKDDHMGVVNFHGDTLIPFIYDGLRMDEKTGLLVARKGDRETAFIPGDTAVNRFSVHPLVPVRDGVQSAVNPMTNNFCDAHGHYVFSPGHFQQLYANGNLFVCKNDKERFGLLDSMGHVLLTDTFLQLPAAVSGNDNYARQQLSPQDFPRVVFASSRAGTQLFNVDQHTLSSPVRLLKPYQLPNGGEFPESIYSRKRLLYSQANGLGLIYSTGEEIIPPQYQRIEPFVTLQGNECTWIASRNPDAQKRYVGADVYSSEGKLIDIIRQPFTSLGLIWQRPLLYEVKQGYLSGIAGAGGKEIIPAIYLSIDELRMGSKQDTLFLMATDEKQVLHLFSADGKALLEAKEVRPLNVSGHVPFVLVRTDSTCEIRDLKMRKRFSMKANDMRPLAKGQFLFTENGEKWGIVDSTGKVLLPPEYDGIDAAVTSDNYCYRYSSCTKNGRQQTCTYGLINAKTLERLTPPGYTAIRAYADSPRLLWVTYISGNKQFNGCKGVDGTEYWKDE